MNEGTSTRAAGDFRGTEAARFGGEAVTDVSTSVVVAVADADGVDPVEMDERLHDWVDPDALDAVVGSMDSGAVEFEMADHRVRVRADGHVLIDGHE